LRLTDTHRIDYAGAANLISKRRFPPLPVNHANLIYSPFAMRPPNAAVFKDAPERYDLYRDLVHAIHIVESVIKWACLQLPNAPENCALVNNLDRELYELFLFPEQPSIVGRRCLIQEVWRLAAIICISAASRLYHPDLAGVMGKFLQKLHALIDTTMEWGNMIQVLVLSLLDGRTMETLENTEQLSSLMTLSISLTWENWRTVKLRLLHFLVQEEDHFKTYGDRYQASFLPLKYMLCDGELINTNVVKG
jgi:hypothetical protein